ncbi:MAG: ABC transporter permease [Streptosporangiales bacterium]|nr:ABC transporter permease [Streptosporangiales bacterium]
MRLRPRHRAVLALVLVIVVLATVRIISGAHELTSGGTVGAALVLAVPIGLAALGGLWAERSGIINIGLEGMMILGTWFGGWGAYMFGSPWMGLLTGVLGGALGGLIHALATVTFAVDHIVSGVAINILAFGLARYLSIVYFAEKEGGGASQSPPLPGFGSVGVPGVGAPLARLEQTHWFLLADLAGIVRGLTTGLSVLTLIALLLVPLSYVILWRTSLGLRLRSVGENPVAAESLGVPVYTMKYLAVVISGALAGLGGVFLAMVASSAYQEGQTGGRGYIGLAAMIFGNWRPGGLAAGAGLFGFADALQLRGNIDAVHALLLVVAAGLGVLAVVAAMRRRPVAAVLSAVFAAALFAWFFASDTVPRQIVSYTPHITTLLVLSLATQRLRPPAADGLRYRKGEGG